VSVVSVSELRRALLNQRLDVEIMRCIARMRSPNVSNIADELGIDRKSARFHLYKLKAEGCVKDRWIGMTSPVGNQILCHEWQLTGKGERILHEGGLLFPAFRKNGSPPALSRKVEARKEEVGWLLPPTGAHDSEANYHRAEQAANMLHAFSLVQRAPRSR